jgi:hypothetical protein
VAALFIHELAHWIVAYSLGMSWPNAGYKIPEINLRWYIKAPFSPTPRYHDIGKYLETEVVNWELCTCDRKFPDLTIDIGIYSLFYFGFLWFIFPLVFHLMGSYGAGFPSYSLFFLEIAWFCKMYFYLPVLVLISIVAWFELHTHVFYSWLTKFLVKCTSAIFFLCAMIAIPLPMALNLTR